MFIYNKTETKGVELVNRQGFPAHVGSGIFQENFSNSKFYRFI